LIEITEDDFDCNEILKSLRNEHIGAEVTFIGTVRGFSEAIGKEGQPERVAVKELIYECYCEMALGKMTQIKDHALANYDIDDMHIIHRIGVLKPTEQVVMIAVSAAHRKDAFKACEYAIEEMKKAVPIWKKEITKSGQYWIGSDMKYKGSE
jgi:molybdopterin synthase catalytic subunit